eukprot:GFUD01012266.1.p1 GENE.GFUD01012266.1~~GFUD01012266.1.p1  ORF type:complete len:106 (-),score=13.90 GFUD01012266.1:238-555(-)
MAISQMFSKLPSFGIGLPWNPWTSLVERAYNNEVTQVIVRADTPIDLYIEFINLLAKIPGMNILKIDRSNGHLITWNEMNEVLLNNFRSIKSFPTWAVQLLNRSN